MKKEDQQKFYKNLPDTPGVYLMRGKKNKLLYVGKAANLRRRVSSYFLRPQETRLEKLVVEIRKVEYRETVSALEALVLESQLIKKYQPPFNIKEKDNRSFLFVEITKEKFPRVRLVRGTELVAGERFGPFVSAASIREALRLLRRIFPWHTHPPETLGKAKRPCLDAQIGLCPGICAGAIARPEYLKTIRHLKMVLGGKTSTLKKSLIQEMKLAAKTKKFELAGKFRRQLFALEHLQDSALIREEREGDTSGFRIEGYDISNISGESAVGSLVVFVGGEAKKSEYKKFRIKTVQGANDFAMLQEVLRRRLNHPEWPRPDLILVDGGVGQVSAVKEVFREKKINIPLVGLAKGSERKRNDLIGTLPKGVKLEVLIRVRDEAHRFAVAYHQKVRSRKMFQ